MKIIFIITACLLGCTEKRPDGSIQKEQEKLYPIQVGSDFPEFTENFPNVSLPINLDEKAIQEFSSNKMLDSAFVTKFVEPNKVLRGQTKLFDIYEYFPVVKFFVRDSIIVVIVYKRGGVGGIDNTLLMLSYNNTEKKSFIAIGQILGDCSFMNIIESIIKEDYTIEQIERHLKLDCDTEQIQTESIVKKRYLIDSTGQIIDF